MDRNRAIATAIKGVLDQHKWTIESILNDIPRGFWGEVSANIPQNPTFPTAPGNLSNHWRRDAKNRNNILAKLKALYTEYPRYETNKTQSPQPTQPTHYLTEAEVRRIVSDELDKRFTAVNAIEHNLHNKLAPEPPRLQKDKTGRKTGRKYIRLSITLDQNLYSLFEEERVKLRITAPRLLDSIFWNHYDRPKMSWE